MLHFKILINALYFLSYVESVTYDCAKLGGCGALFFQIYGRNYDGKFVVKRAHPNTLCRKGKFTYEQKLALCVAIWEDYNAKYKLGEYQAPVEDRNDECVVETVHSAEFKTKDLDVKVFECPMSNMRFAEKENMVIDNIYLARGIHHDPSAFFMMVESDEFQDARSTLPSNESITESAGEKSSRIVEIEKLSGNTDFTNNAPVKLQHSASMPVKNVTRLLSRNFQRLSKSWRQHGSSRNRKGKKILEIVSWHHGEQKFLDILKIK